MAARKSKFRPHTSHTSHKVMPPQNRKPPSPAGRKISGTERGRYRP